MTENEKVVFGATVEDRLMVPPSTPNTNSIRDAPPSPLTISSTPAREPGSPFDPPYNHDDANSTSHDLKQAPMMTHDLESQRDLGLLQTESSRPSCKKEDSMWPSLKSQKAKAKQQKQAKSWNPMAKMGRRQKIIVTAIIALVVIGAAVGIGVGVSKAVGGGVSKVGGGTRPIGENQKRI